MNQMLRSGVHPLVLAYIFVGIGLNLNIKHSNYPQLSTYTSDIRLMLFQKNQKCANVASIIAHLTQNDAFARDVLHSSCFFLPLYCNRWLVTTMRSGIGFSLFWYAMLYHLKRCHGIMDKNRKHTTVCWSELVQALQGLPCILCPHVH